MLVRSNQFFLNGSSPVALRCRTRPNFYFRDFENAARNDIEPAKALGGPRKERRSSADSALAGPRRHTRLSGVRSRGSSHGARRFLGGQETALPAQATARTDVNDQSRGRLSKSPYATIAAPPIWRVCCSKRRSSASFTAGCKPNFWGARQRSVRAARAAE
jgi:hypothetical protein